MHLQLVLLLRWGGEVKKVYMHKLLYYAFPLQQLFKISVLFLVIQTHLNINSYAVKYFEQLISQVVDCC